jgi:hypothetical protein
MNGARPGATKATGIRSEEDRRYTERAVTLFVVPSTSLLMG